MKLTENVVKNFRVAKIFRENTDKITSIDFSSNGETLISSSDDDSIVIYDCQGGTQVYSSCVFARWYLENFIRYDSVTAIINSRRDTQICLYGTISNCTILSCPTAQYLSGLNLCFVLNPKFPFKRCILHYLSYLANCCLNTCTFCDTLQQPNTQQLSQISPVTLKCQMRPQFNLHRRPSHL